MPPPAAAAKSLQSCPTLCNPMDGSPPGSPVPGILQARTLEWVAISLSNAGKWKVKVKSLSHVRLLATTWTAASQAPLSLGFSRQECWSGVPLPSPTPPPRVLQTSLFPQPHVQPVFKSQPGLLFKFLKSTNFSPFPSPAPSCHFCSNHPSSLVE